MKKIALIIVSLMIFSVTFANKTSEENSKGENAVMTTSVSGKVFDKITGEALAGVKVTIDGTNKSVYTDFDGNFEIEGLREGEVEIMASYISYEEKSKKVNVCLSKSNAIDVEIESITK